MTPRSIRLCGLFAGALTVTALSSCASERYQAQMRKEKAEKDQYVDYYPVGSRIAVRVPKDQAKASAEETERTQEVFREVQSSGVKTPGDSSGH